MYYFFSFGTITTYWIGTDMQFYFLKINWLGKNYGNKEIRMNLFWKAHKWKFVQGYNHEFSRCHTLVSGGKLISVQIFVCKSCRWFVFVIILI
jgi:hypothetical protein